MVHMTCKRTKTAKEDLAYVVKKFLRATTLESNVSRTPTDSHTQTVSADQQSAQVIRNIQIFTFIKSTCAIIINGLLFLILGEC